jgi:hypothetical protein
MICRSRARESQESRTSPNLSDRNCHSFLNVPSLAFHNLEVFELPYLGFCLLKLSFGSALVSISLVLKLQPLAWEHIFLPGPFGLLLFTGLFSRHHHAQIL